MSYVQYRSTRERERDLFDDDSLFARPLVRRNSKRAHVDFFDDDEADDYPLPSSHKTSKSSRALTIRQPSELERYNIWSPSSSKYHAKESKSYDDDEEDTVRYRYKTTRYTSRSDDDDDDDRSRDREFRLKVKATFGRPKSSSSSRRVTYWPADTFTRREKWEDVDWETREREKRRDSLFDDEDVKEKLVRFRKIKRTRTDEWKPLSGWRRV